MSRNGLEVVLYELGTRREARTSFAQDASAFLARYRLSAEEAGMVESFDVAGLQRCGVSPLLTYGYWMMNEPGRSRSAYLARLSAGK